MTELILRRYKTADAEQLKDLDDSPKDYQENAHKKSIISAEEYAAEVKQTEDELGWLNYTVVLSKNNKEKIIGSVVFRDMEPKENRRAYIDYYLDKSCRGKGYGTILVELIIEIAKKKNFNKLMADPEVNNKGSCKILEKNGFRLVGVLKRHEKQNWSERFDDKALYEILL
jgi:RimJ/RimL family protein N-acetyltransferase